MLLCLYLAVKFTQRTLTLLFCLVLIMFVEVKCHNLELSESSFVHSLSRLPFLKLSVVTCHATVFPRH